MSALEQEIVEKFRQLQPAAKQRVWALIEQEVNSEVEQAEGVAFDYAGWVRDVEALREQIRTNQGGLIPSLDVIEMLRDIRDGEDE